MAALGSFILFTVGLAGVFICSGCAGIAIEKGERQQTLTCLFWSAFSALLTFAAFLIRP